MSKPHTTIKPRNDPLGFGAISELWEYRDLFYVLTERDIKLRYKQTFLGIGWVIFQPLVSTAIFTLLFSRFTSFPTGSIPYPLFAYIGLVYWTFFSNSLTAVSGSLQGSEGLMKKVYFPRLIPPCSTIVVNIVDFFIGSLILLVFLVVYSIVPPLAFWISYIIGFICICLAVLGAGLFLAALNVKYRDVRYILPFFIQILIFLTPVFFPLSIVSPQNRWILSLNPLTTVIETNRKFLTDRPSFNPADWLLLVAVITVMLFVGMAYFKRTEAYFTDII